MTILLILILLLIVQALVAGLLMLWFGSRFKTLERYFAAREKQFNRRRSRQADREYLVRAEFEQLVIESLDAQQKKVQEILQRFTGEEKPRRPDLTPFSLGEFRRRAEERVIKQMREAEPRAVVRT